MIGLFDLPVRISGAINRIFASILQRVCSDNLYFWKKLHVLLAALLKKQIDDFAVEPFWLFFSLPLSRSLVFKVSPSPLLKVVGLGNNK